jgi:hypothetical protein
MDGGEKSIYKHFHLKLVELYYRLRIRESNFIITHIRHICKCS